MLLLGLVDVPLWVILVCIIFAIYIIHNTWYFNYFKKQGIRGKTPLPILGNIRFWGLKKYPYTETDLQQEYGDVFAEFLGRLPCLIVHDETFLAQVLVKDFPTFCDRASLLSGDEVSDAMLLNMQGDDWKRVRSCMTPTFSTGKLKQMIPEVNRCAQQLVDSLLELADTGTDIDIRKFTGAFSMDVIASTAFGMRVDSLKDTNSVFVQKAKRGFSRTLLNPLLLVAFFFPFALPLLTKLGLNGILPRDVVDFFLEVTKKAVESRKDDPNQSRTDFLQLVLNAERQETGEEEAGVGADDTETKPAKRELSTTEILANAILFFVAGYDTTATTLAMLLYNLARAPDCQEKLREEIDNVIGDQETISYDKLSELPYLDQCISESLRLFPPLIRANREAGKDVTINGIHMKKGMVVMIPIFGIHRDPLKWPDPEKFDPTRFSPEKKANRSPFHYMPFGTGPRHCIAMRLAMAELKIAMIYLLRKVAVSPTGDPQARVEFSISGLLKPTKAVTLKVKSWKKSD